MAVRDFDIRDERFRQCIRTSANIERLHTGCRWTEGPVYFPAMRSLLFSDIPNDRVLRFDEQSEAVSVFRQPADYTNGNTVDRQGRLVGILVRATPRYDGRSYVRMVRMTHIATKLSGALSRATLETTGQVTPFLP